MRALSQILPFLYLGGLLDSRNVEQLKRLDISRVLNVSESSRPSDDPAIVVRHIPISDFGDTDLAAVLGECVDFISAAKTDGRKILVHCRHGQNRSPTVVLAYLVLHENLSLKDAYRTVVTIRPQVAVHESYFEQLQHFEQQHSGKSTVSQSDLGPSVQQVIRDLRGDPKKDS